MKTTTGLYDGMPSNSPNTGGTWPAYLEAASSRPDGDAVRSLQRLWATLHVPRGMTTGWPEIRAFQVRASTGPCLESSSPKLFDTTPESRHGSRTLK